MIKEMTKKIAFGEITQQETSIEFCELCKQIRPVDTECSIPDSYANSK